MNSLAVSRRRFLAGLLASPILLPAVKYFLPPVGGWPVGFSTATLRYKTTERFSWGATDPRAFYGSADGVALVSRAHPMSAAAFRAIVGEGVRRVWEEEYDKSDTDWASLYQQEPVIELSPDSLKEIEIELQPTADALGRISLLPEKKRVATADARRVLGGDRERESRLLLPRLFGLRKGEPGGV